MQDLQGAYDLSSKQQDFKILYERLQNYHTDAAQQLKQQLFLLINSQKCISPQQFIEYYRRRYALPYVKPSEAIKLLWQIQSVRSNYLDYLRCYLRQITRFSVVFREKQQAQLLFDNLVRKIKHYFLMGRYQIASFDQLKCKVALNNLGNKAAVAQFYGFLFCGEEDVISFGFVSCEQQWKQFDEDKAIEIVLSGTVAEEKEIYQQLQHAYNNADFCQPDADLQTAVEYLLYQQYSLDHQLQNATKCLQEMMEIYRIQRFQQYLDDYLRLNDNMTVYQHFVALQQINKAIFNYVKNSNLTRFSKEMEQEDLSIPFQAYLAQHGVVVFDQNPDDVIRQSRLYLKQQ